MADDADRLAIALEYAAHGFALLPLAPCGKVPSSKLLPRDPETGKPKWKPLATEHATQREITRWFDQHPTTNIGVICGQASNGLAVLDFDVEPPRDLHVPISPRVITGRGEHVYVRSQDCLRSRVLYHGGQRIGELKGDGGYAVLPPSTHPTGHVYQWADCLSPADLSWSFADAPAWACRPALSHSSLSGGDVQSTRGNGKQVENILYSLTPGCSGIALGAWDSRDDFVAAGASLLGIDAAYHTGANLGKTFRCILPGHNDRHPSASLYRRDDGLVVYRDWHAASGSEWYYLAELKASAAYGRAVKLKPPELATWHLRLLVETGYLLPASVDMPRLPFRVRPAVQKVYDGFRLLLGCKWLHTPGAPTPFSWRFASAWCGVSERHAGLAIQELMRHAAIRTANAAGSRTRDLTLFLPGDKPSDESWNAKLRPQEDEYENTEQRTKSQIASDRDPFEVP